MNWYGISGIILVLIPAILWFRNVVKTDGWDTARGYISLIGFIVGVLVWGWAVIYLLQAAGWAK